MKNYLLVGLLTATSALYSQKNEVSFSAQVENRTSDSVMIQNQNGFKKIIVANKNGVFTDQFKVEDGIYYFSIKKNYTKIYLKSNAKINLSTNESDFDKSMRFSGDFTKENAFLAKQLMIDDSLFNADIDEATLLEVFKNRVNGMEQTMKSAQLEEKFSGIFLAEFKSEAQGNISYLENTVRANALNGKPSPLFSYENHKGGTTSLTDFKGKYVYVDVWATWCGPCKAEIPSLKKMEEKYHEANIVFVSISVDTKKDYEKWKMFVTDKELGGVQLVADKDWSSDFVKAYLINGIPRFILIDPAGNVVQANAPRPSDPKLVTLLDGLLK
uniref:TlpA family protein disulfide reductase n=1 Tax=Fluviicola sp. TaxID=1917219 RepID=UPI00404B529F